MSQNLSMCNAIIKMKIDWYFSVVWKKAFTKQFAVKIRNFIWSNLAKKGKKKSNYKLDFGVYINVMNQEPIWSDIEFVIKAYTVVGYVKI